MVDMETLAWRSLTRRQVLQRGLALGLSAPVIAGLLAACGGDDDDDATTPTTGAGTGAATATTGTDAAEATATTGEAGAGVDATATSGDGGSDATATTGAGTGAAEPTATTGAAVEAGGGGLLRILSWQAPTILNPHLATGGKDWEASRVVYEPLADIDAEGNGVPMLATEWPTIDNGGLAADGTSVTWKLREGVTWHDGQPFTASDVVFTWEYASDEGTSAVSKNVFSVVSSVEAVDDFTVTVSFTEPNPAWFDVFTSHLGMILPRHIFEASKGADAANAPENLAPVGTGPFKVSDFRPGDVVLYDRNEAYWDAGKPYFDSVEIKGGGDAISSARAVLVSGEADFGLYIQAEPAILNDMQGSDARGRLIARPGATIEVLLYNFADPRTEVDGARSEPSTEHPILKNLDVRKALTLGIQRDVIAEQLYGPAGVVSANVLNAPPRFVSPNTSWEYNLDEAASLLEGYPETQGFDLLLQTSLNSVRQKTQEVIKQAWESLGFSVELKAVDAAVYFSTDAGNPDTFTKFYADAEMYETGPASPFPVTWFNRYRSDRRASKENEWRGVNLTRWNNPEFDALHDLSKTEMDEDAQNDLFIQMNDMVVENYAEICLVHRTSMTVAANTLTDIELTPWARNMWLIKNWRRAE